MPTALDHSQRLFGAALRDTDSDACVAPLLLGEAAAKRLTLYRDGISALHANALANAYPVVRALVGADYFGQLARAYGQKCPSRSGDLHDFGADLAQFCSGHAGAQELRYLADVASLEWLVHRARFAADTEPVTHGEIAALGPSDLLNARFALAPACAWMFSRFAVASLWRAHQREGLPMPTDIELGETVLVVRRAWRVDVVTSCRAETAILQALRAGHRLSVAISAGRVVDDGFDFPRALVRWLDDGILIAVGDLPH